MIRYWWIGHESLVSGCGLGQSLGGLTCLTALDMFQACEPEILVSFLDFVLFSMDYILAHATLHCASELTETTSLLLMALGGSTPVLPVS